MQTAELMLINSLKQHCTELLNLLPKETKEAHLQTKKDMIIRLNEMLNLHIFQSAINIPEIIAFIQNNTFITAIKAENTSTFLFNIFNVTPSQACLNNMNTQIDYYEQRKKIDKLPTCNTLNQLTLRPLCIE